MKRAITSIAIVCVLSGCSIIEFERNTETVMDAVEAAEPIITAVEDTTAKGMSEDTANTGEKVADGVTKVAKTAEKIADAAGSKTIASILATISVLSTGAAAFFRRRKNQMKKALVKAGDTVVGGGKAVAEAAKSEGVSDEVHKHYAETHTDA